MSEAPGEIPALPLRSRKGDVEVFVHSRDRGILALDRKKRSFWLPEQLHREGIRVPATTRNWNTVCKVAALGQSSKVMAGN